MTEDKIKRSYWYMFFVEECVICGHTNEHKIRVYDKPKPDDVYERHIYSQFVCGCHFL